MTPDDLSDNPLWDQVADRLNELNIPKDDHSMNEVGRFLNTPGAMLICIDKPNYRIFGCLVPKPGA